MLKNAACLREGRLPSAPALFRPVPFTPYDIFTTSLALNSLFQLVAEWPGMAIVHPKVTEVLSTRQRKCDNIENGGSKHFLNAHNYSPTYTT
jgi:hypothetical protein